MDKDTIAKLKQRLLEEKSLVENELRSVAARDPNMKDDWDATFPQYTPEESGSHSSLEDSAEEVKDYEVSLEMEHELETRLQNINRALDKIENGTYGLCEKCNQAINDERLEANPAALFDLEHEPK